MKKMRWGALMVVLFILVVSTEASATIHYVPDDFDTIQGAIDAALDGDTIIVRDGVYEENINYFGKTIVLKSLNGSNNTIIDGGGADRVVIFSSGEKEGTVLEGFTIRNGHAKNFNDYNGGGILIKSSSPRIENCTIEGNKAHKGGGIYIELDIFSQYHAVLKNCIIQDNTALETGGGLYLKAASISYHTAQIDISGCIIENNTALDDGGGLIALLYQFSALKIDQCTVTDNSAPSIGGIGVTVYNTTSAVLISACMVARNTAEDYDCGGIYAKNSSGILAIENCTIQANFAKRGGGGIFVLGDPEIRNCRILENTAGGGTLFGGGGIYGGTYATLNVVNCQIIGNKTTQYDSKGGGIFIGNNASANIDFCVIENNSANGTNASGGGISLESTWSYPNYISNTIIQNNTAVGRGGGIFSLVSSPNLSNCEIINNAASVGGGVFLYSSDDPQPTFKSCKFLENTATVKGGGAFYTYESDPVISNSTFFRNVAGSWYGGAVYVSSDTLTAINSSFTENSTTYSGGAVYLSYSSMMMANCIVWGDLPNELSGSFGNYLVTFSDVQGGWIGAGNINSDPLFVGGDDLRLTTGSPCIDAGTNDAPGIPDTDFEGDPRIIDGNNDGSAIVDMGADEIDRCVGDFDEDGNIDGLDMAIFAADCGRTDCDAGETCEGNIDSDNDVDGSDLAVFIADYGRTGCPGF